MNRDQQVANVLLTSSVSVILCRDLVLLVGAYVSAGVQAVVFAPHQLRISVSVADENQLLP